MTASIRRRLTLSLLLTLIVVFTAALAALYLSVRDELIDGYDDALIAKARAISTLVVVDDVGSLRATINDRFMRDFDDDDARSFFQLWDASGRTLERSRSLAGGLELPRRTGTLEEPQYFFMRFANGKAARAVGIAFTPQSTHRNTAAPLPGLQLVVATRSNHLDHELRELLVESGAWAAGLLAVITLLVPWLLHRGLRPLDRLADDVSRVSATTLHSRFTTAGLPRELAPITITLNALLSRLEESFERERRVSAAMAHELRTPIAELRTLAESALKWPAARPADADAEVLAIATQMEALVTRMLALARSESGQIAASLERIDVQAVMERAWQPLARLAESRQLRVDFNIAATRLDADPALLQSILSNLLENAVCYAREGSVIDVVGAAAGESFLLAVGNEAPDLAAADVVRLFERFWRGEAARGGGQHMGLGLALVREFAQAMGWRVEARVEARQKLVIELRAPLPAH